MATKKTLYDYCMQYGYGTAENVEKARNYAAETGSNILKALLETAVLKENELLFLLKEVYKMDTVESLSDLSVDTTFTTKFNTAELIRHQMVPYRGGKTVKIAVANPMNTVIIEDYIKEVIPTAVRFEYVLTTASQIEDWLNRDNGAPGARTIDISEFEVVESDTESQVYDILQNDLSSIVNFVNNVFLDAYRRRASDIHVEPLSDRMVIRFRIDGILERVMQVPKSIHRQIINRIKTMSGMDVNNTRITQDGSIRLKLQGKTLDMRVGLLPTICSEKATIRLLDNSWTDFNIKMACFSEDNERQYHEVIERPNGIVLITGPTGSGKSTTLYGTLAELNTPQRCIITIEDPVEITLDGLVQIDVSELTHGTFAGVFRQVLRQDPDIILVGEIRDVETAKIAVQASNTGHLVFSTLHTNSAAASIVRLIEMGVEPYMVSSTVNAVVSQRLVRRICPACKTAYAMPQQSPYRQVLGEGDHTLFKGNGCDKCHGTGYYGRIPIQEILILNNEVRNAIHADVTTQAIEQLAKQNGMRDIFEDGIAKALCGDTTMDEIHRVLHFENITFSGGK